MRNKKSSIEMFTEVQVAERCKGKDESVDGRVVCLQAVFLTRLYH